MKKSFYLGAAFITMMAASCQNDELVDRTNDTEGQQFEITLNKGVDSRTTLGTGKKTLWSAGDKVFVTSTDGTVTGELELIQGTGTSTGKFRGTVKGGHPSNLKHIVFPALKNGKIDMSGRDEGQLDAPMLGEIPSTNNSPVTMNNVGGLLAVMIDGAGSQGLKLKTKATIGTEEKNMTGGFYTFDASTGKLQYTSVDSPVPVLTPEDGYAYIPVATTTAPTDGKEESTSQTVSVKVVVSNASNTTVVETVNPVTITKGEIMGDESGENTGLNVNVDNQGTATQVVIVTNQAELKEALSLTQNEGKIIRLANDLKDLTQGFEVSIQNVTLDLNGKSIEVLGDDVFDVSGSLIIDGRKASVVKTGGLNQNGEGVCVVWAHGGRVTINGGYYQADIDDNGNRSDCIYAGYNADNKETVGHITINNGYFEFLGKYTLDNGESGYDVNKDGDTFLLNCANSDANKCQIVVNGGFFKNHVPTLENYGTTNEVILGENKNVYLPGKENPVNVKHSGADVIWYEVK